MDITNFTGYITTNRNGPGCTVSKYKDGIELCAIEYKLYDAEDTPELLAQGRVYANALSKKAINRRPTMTHDQARVALEEHGQ